MITLLIGLMPENMHQPVRKGANLNLEMVAEPVLTSNDNTSDWADAREYAPQVDNPAVRASLPRKRRKIAHAQDPPAGARDVRMNISDAGEETGDEGHAVVLESDGETYLVAPGPSPSEGFVLSVLVSTPSTAGKIMDVVEEPENDKNTITAPAPPPASSAGENSSTTSDAPKDDQKMPVADLPLPQLRCLQTRQCLRAGRQKQPPGYGFQV
ncbi:hypothetical protein BDR05DRAFT_1057973 [Suillus weaverae]|nr:hypothetical protein BDR05DRAFT_1057973 [Suillus weaverae]